MKKQECQITLCNPKIKDISLYLHATRPKQSLSAMTIVNVQTLSNQNSLASSKHFLRTRSDDAWPLIEFTPCEKQKYHVTFVTKNKHRHAKRAGVIFCE